MTTPSEFIPWLLQNGWTKSEHTLQLISPSGVPYDTSKILDLEPVFQQVKRVGNEVLQYPQSRYGGPNPSNALSVTKKWTPYEKLKMRLDLGLGETFGMDYCNIYEGPNLTFVFLAKGDKAIVLEDTTSIFPSDSLIGQFRFFQQAVE